MSNYMDAFNKAREEQYGTGSSASGNNNVSSLLEDDKFSVLSEYMRDKTGMTEDEYSREEIRRVLLRL